MAKLRINDSPELGTLRSTIAKRGWSVLQRGNTLDLDQYPDCVVVGVALWSQPDVEGATQWNLISTAGRRVFIFDIDDCQTLRDIGDFLPGAPPPMETPIVAEYGNGQLLRCVTGKAALRVMVAPDSGTVPE